MCLYFFKPPVTELHGRIQEFGPGHWKHSQPLEEDGGVWVSREGAASRRVEEKNLAPETVYHEGPETWPHDKRHQVRAKIPRFVWWRRKRFEELKLFILSDEEEENSSYYYGLNRINEVVFTKSRTWDSTFWSLNISFCLSSSTKNNLFPHNK